MTDACGKAFQGLYDNSSVVAQMVNRHWDVVSKRFAGHDGVLAYEMLNEPWIGDYISNPALLLESGKAEKETVGPFMERIHAIIRKNDNDTPILYAPAEVNNRAMRKVGYEDGFLAGEPMAFHTYCITGTDGAGNIIFTLTETCCHQKQRLDSTILSTQVPQLLQRSNCVTSTITFNSTREKRT